MNLLLPEHLHEPTPSQARPPASPSPPLIQPCQPREQQVNRLSIFRRAMLAGAIVAALCMSVRGGAQEAGTVVLVKVGDATNGAFLPGAYIRMSDRKAVVRTDALGEARIAGVPAGTHGVEVLRLGYAPLHVRAEVSGRDSTELVFMLQPAAIALPPMRVVEPWVARSLREFEARRRSHVGGYFLTSADIDRLSGMSVDAIIRRKIPGVVVRGSRISAFVYSMRGGNALDGGCQVAVYLDGVRVSDGDIALVPIEWVGGIEYHPPGFVPVQYREMARRGTAPNGTPTQTTIGGSAACGVLLLWSKA